MPDFIANRYGHYKHGDLDTYAALARLAAKQDRPLYPHIETIAKIARRSIRTVKRAIKKFQADLVLIVNKTGRASNYVLVPLLPTGFPDPESGEYIIAKAMAGCRQIPKSGDYLYVGNADYDVSKVPVRGVQLSPQECPHVTSEVPKCHHAYNKETHTLNTTTTTPPPTKLPHEPEPSPPPETPPQSSVVVSLHEKIKPDHRVKVALSTLKKALALYTENQVETLISHINDPKKEIKSGGAYIAEACKAAESGEKWEIAEFDSSKIIDPEIQRKNQEENLQKQRDMTDESIKLKNITVDGFFEGANQMRIAMGLTLKTKPTGKKNNQIQKPTNILEDKDKIDARKTLLKLQLEQYQKAENDNKKDN